MRLAKIEQLQPALKEWAIAVDALTTGKTIVLLRKGGIREAKFGVEYPVVWLYPTYEHQKPHLLKPQYASSVVSVESGWHPNTVEIKSCAEIKEALPISNSQQIEALQPYHIWNEQMVSDRLKWKPRQPLVVLLLKVYRFPQPRIVPYHDAYGGCKSWIDLIEPISTEGLIRAIGEEDFEHQVREIKAVVQERASI